MYQRLLGLVAATCAAVVLLGDVDPRWLAIGLFAAGVGLVIGNGTH